MNDFETVMLAVVNDRVARGALWLDRTCPDWDKIVADRLDVSSWETCVLGQLSCDYDPAAAARSSSRRGSLTTVFSSKPRCWFPTTTSTQRGRRSSVHAEPAASRRGTARLVRRRGIAHRCQRQPSTTPARASQPHSRSRPPHEATAPARHRWTVVDGVGDQPISKALWLRPKRSKPQRRPPPSSLW
jgi:hypothetical protein